MYTITTRALWDQYIKEEDTKCVAVKGFPGLCKPVCTRVQGIVLSLCYYQILTVVGYSLVFASTSSNFPEWRIDAAACHITIPSLHFACDLCTVHCAMCMWSHLPIAPLSVIIACPRQKYCCRFFLEWGWSSQATLNYIIYIIEILKERESEVRLEHCMT